MTLETEYLVMFPSRCFEVSFSICGYFDNRPRINIGLIFYKIILVLPFRNKWTDECDCPTWGIAYHEDMLWIHRGGKGNLNGGSKWWAFQAPWSYSWVRTSALRKDGGWEHETIGNNKSFYREEWENILWSETYPYTYVLKSGEVQNRKAKLRVEEREWRMHGFKWSSFRNKIEKTISVDFDAEVGERTGSWKGGTTGCGYTLLQNETPLECLRRMEKERMFN